MDEDWEWIGRFQEGDASAFGLLFNKYKGLVIKLAYRFVRQREAAEDIAQDVFIKIYEKKVKVDPGAKFTTWLYRVTVNAALDVVRKKRFLKFSFDEVKQGQSDSKQTLADTFADPAAVSPGKFLAQEELSGLLQREINELPEKFKVPILLYQFQNTPYQEIAKILGISEKAVERRIYHAKEVLRTKLTKYM